MRIDRCVIQIRSEYGQYVRYVGRPNALSVKDFFREYWERPNKKTKILKAVDSWFANPQTDD
jgi:hypothetical protein